MFERGAEKMIEIKMNGNGTTAENVRKCLTVLLGTREGEQALDRNFGLNWDFLDMTTAAAKARLTAEIIEKIKKYEPRAKIKSVKFKADVNGLLSPVLEVSVVDE